MEHIVEVYTRFNPDDAMLVKVCNARLNVEGVPVYAYHNEDEEWRYRSLTVRHEFVAEVGNGERYALMVRSDAHGELESLQMHLTLEDAKKHFGKCPECGTPNPVFREYPMLPKDLDGPDVISLLPKDLVSGHIESWADWNYSSYDEANRQDAVHHSNKIYGYSDMVDTIESYRDFANKIGMPPMCRRVVLDNGTIYEGK